MITRLTAKGFRCLREVDQPLRPFEILVGPNASGKSSFLEVIRFLSDAVDSGGLPAAIEKRVGSFQDLVWRREANLFEVAIEAKLPQAARSQISTQAWSETVRYEIAVRVDPETDRPVFATEHVRLRGNSTDVSPATRNKNKMLFVGRGAVGATKDRQTPTFHC